MTPSTSCSPPAVYLLSQRGGKKIVSLKCVSNDLIDNLLPTCQKVRTQMNDDADVNTALSRF